MTKNEQVLIANSDLETKAFAKKIATTNNLESNVYALSGELGAGKTTFAQGFAEGLNITDKIISPTFVLIRMHQIPNSEKIFYHIDLYRLEGNIDLKSTGIDEVMHSNNIVLIEWADKITDFLPENTIKINLEKLEENKRKITIN